MSMVKLIHSGSFDETIGVGAEIIRREGELNKQASTIFGKEYEDLKPDDKHVGIHVVALGDEEHYGCFFAGAYVSTINGQKQIEDIVEGDVVLTHKGNYKKVLKTFTSLYSGTKVTVSVLGLPHDVECTEEHPFLVVKRNGLSPASRYKLRSTGELQNALESRARSAGFVKASELEPGMFLVIPTRPSEEELSKYEAIPEEFDPYVAGFYLAEGCLVKEYKQISTRGEYTEVLLTGSTKDEESFARVDMWLSSIGRSIPVRQPSLTSRYGVRYGFGFKPFAQWLDKVFGHDATTKHLHPQLYKWNDDQLLDFLAGYFDGDGCVHSTKNKYEGTLSASTASRTLALDLQRMLASLGIPASVNQCWNKTKNGCFGHEDFPIYSVCVGSYRSNMILEHTLRLKPHSRKFKAAGASSIQCSRHYALLPISDVQFEKVDDVQKYNFEVEDDNSYVVDVAVHNCNRNADSFPKEACVKYYDTFVKYGHVFRHHRNKDPNKAIGTIKAAAYNEPMGRIELFIHADKEKAAPELERLEKEGEIPFSMATTVPYDVCSICGSMRKKAGDESECDHVANHLGEQFDDGRKVFTKNTEPKFFDISFVGRPADRIAWNLKVASALDLDSVKYAEFEGVSAPDELACESDSSIRKLGYAKDIVSMQDSYMGWLTKSAAVVTARDGYLYEFRKIAATSLDSDTVSRLREQPVKSAMTALADNGILMDVPTFFKYATGDDYEKIVKPYVPGVERTIPNLLSKLVKSSSASTICNDDTYSAYACTSGRVVPQALQERLSKHASSPKDLIFEATIDSGNSLKHEYMLDSSKDSCVNDGVTEKLAQAYLSYELSAIDAAVTGRCGMNKTDAEALASVNNLQKKQG